MMPHMTITESRSDNAADEVMLAEMRSRAPQGTFSMSEIAYAVPDGRFHFEVNWRLPVGGNQG